MFLFGLGFLVVFGWLFVWGIKKLKSLKKYEFEHTTSGGVVEFTNYEASLKHNSGKMFSGFAIIVGMFGAFIGFAILFFLFTFPHPHHY